MTAGNPRDRDVGRRNSILGDSHETRIRLSAQLGISLYTNDLRMQQTAATDTRRDQRRLHRHHAERPLPRP